MVDSQVSVVIPTYNRADLLRAALESVLLQTLPVGEIVVVDDGSTDHTADVVRAFAMSGAPVIYLHGPHANSRGEARNRGVAASNGSLVAFLDSDDLWKPERLQRQLAAWERSPEAGFAFCNVQRFDESGPLGVACLHPAADFNGHVLGAVLTEPRAVSSTLIVKREVFERVGGFADLRMNEDYELSLRLAADYTASYVPEVLVMMREHPGRTSRSASEVPLLDYVRIVEGFLAKRSDLPAPMREAGRRGLANVHYKLGRFYLGEGERRRARDHLTEVLRLRPLDRRALSAYLRLWVPAGSSVPKA
jgi:glycosyltransferase involved in cell wall biosynthesis